MTIFIANLGLCWHVPFSRNTEILPTSPLHACHLENPFRHSFLRSLLLSVHLNTLERYIYRMKTVLVNEPVFKL